MFECRFDGRDRSRWRLVHLIAGAGDFKQLGESSGATWAARLAEMWLRLQARRRMRRCQRWRIG